ncbi:MAG: hypothetical protein MJB57_11060 [Gemmatimonadetes bacterium]|nr:hypothetical protein [Gemmatimonadota bacterium]
MTKTFQDDDGRRWKAWLASREVFWPDPKEKAPPADFEAVVFVCFSDPYQAQRRLRLPQGSFEQLSLDELKKKFKKAEVDPAIRD